MKKTMEKLDSLNLLLNDLFDLRGYLEELNHAILLEDKETINEIKKCINDFDKNAMIIQLIEILEKE